MALSESWDSLPHTTRNPFDGFQRYLKEKLDIHTKTKVNKSSALHIAVKRNHKDCVSLLLNMGIRIDERDALGRTALHYAAIQGDIRIHAETRNLAMSPGST